MLHFLCTGGVSGLSCAGDPLVLPARLIGSQTLRRRLTAASGVVMPKKGWVWEGRQAEPVQTGHFALGPTSWIHQLLDLKRRSAVLATNTPREPEYL